MLHAISIYLIYHLYVLNKQNEHENHTEIIRIFDTYLKEIKEENKRLLSYNNNEDRILENEPVTNSKPKHKEHHLLYDETDSNHITDFLKEKPNDSIETSIHAKVLQLYQKGLSVEEIAKQLDCGKTEAELIIKFYGSR